MNDLIEKLITFLRKYNAINDKAKLAEITSNKFSLTKDRSVYYCKDFAIRFSSSKTENFSNTVLSLSNLQKFDDRPFIVCLVTHKDNHAYLANTTFLKKISHSSQQLRENNIRGSFNGSDIMRSFEGITNSPENFEKLFDIHSAIGFEENIPRLVETTNDISPTGKKFEPNETQRRQILLAPERAIKFIESHDMQTLQEELDRKIKEVEEKIFLAAHTDNVKKRGSEIEHLIVGKSNTTVNDLGDFSKSYDKFLVKIDVKTKLMEKNSNPKAYNLDKMLEFLTSDQSVFMFYFVSIDESKKKIETSLISIFQEQLLDVTILLKHWAGRNSRGVSQLEGKVIKQLICSPSNKINLEKSRIFLKKILDL